MTISQKDVKLLWSRAAGRCTLCQRELSQDKIAAPGTVIVGEQAHIVAEETDGPRGASILTIEERNSYYNLILLCPTHHTEIDKNLEDFPIEKLHILKARHEAWVQHTLSKAAHKTRADVLAIDDVLEFYERLRPLILWLHRIIPKEQATPYFAAMQLFWTVSNSTTRSVPQELRVALDRLLRPVAAETHIFQNGRHYVDSNICAGATSIVRHFHKKRVPDFMPTPDGKSEDVLRDLNMYCEVAQQHACVDDGEVEVLKFVRLIAQHYQKYFSNRGPVEISETMTDQFIAILSPFLSERLGISFPDKADDSAVDRIQRFAGARKLL